MLKMSMVRVGNFHVKLKKGNLFSSQAAEHGRARRNIASASKSLYRFFGSQQNSKAKLFN